MRPRIFERWFTFPEICLLPLPLMSGNLIALLLYALRHLPTCNDSWVWFPFAAPIVLFALAFFRIAYSFYPYVVPEQLTIHEAVNAPESLFIILIRTVFVLPVIAGYTVVA